VKKFIFLFLLLNVIGYSQQGWRDSIATHRTELNAKQDSITYLRSEITSLLAKNISERIDGFYYDNVPASLSSGFMARGLGRMGSSYRILRDCYLSGIGVYVSPDDEVSAGTITIELYKNGVVTDYDLTLDPTLFPSMNLLNVPFEEYKVYGGDYFQLVITSSSDLSPSGSIDVNGVLEFDNIEEPNATTRFTLTTLAVDSGTVTVTPSKTDYGYGETVTLTSAANTGWNHWTWTGDIDIAQSLDTVMTVTMVSDRTIRARYNKEDSTARVLIVDQEANIETGHAANLRSGFIQAYELYGDNWGDFGEDSIAYSSVGYLTQGVFELADRLGAEMIIYSLAPGKDQTTLDLAQKYYPMQVFEAVGNDSTKQIIKTNGILPSVILSGTTPYGNPTIYNRTSNDIEFVGYDMISASPAYANSFSNPYTAGIFMLAVDKYYRTGSYKDYWGVRYTSRCEEGTFFQKTWTVRNGFGFIDDAVLLDTDQVTFYQANVLSNQYFYRNTDPYLSR
jgi:hypothetical protein